MTTALQEENRNAQTTKKYKNKGKIQGRRTQELNSPLAIYYMHWKKNSLQRNIDIYTRK